MKTKFPKLAYSEKNKMIESEFKKNPDNKKNIMASIKGINKKLDAIRKTENDLLWDLGIYHSLLYLTLHFEAEKAGFKTKKAKVIFIKDNSEHRIGGTFLDKESLELAVNLEPHPNVSALNYEFPIKLKHIKLK